MLKVHLLGLLFKQEALFIQLVLTGLQLTVRIELFQLDVFV